jgi:hypothetical protein
VKAISPLVWGSRSGGQPYVALLRRRGRSCCSWSGCFTVGPELQKGKRSGVSARGRGCEVKGGGGGCAY